MKILVPLDGSGLSEVVLPWAKLLGSKVELMKSYMPLDNIKLSPELPITIAEMVNDMDVHKNVKKYLIRQAEKLDGPEVTVYCAIGQPADSILLRSDEFDLVVMASHGHSGITRWLLGSVTTKVVRAGTTPVLVVSARPDPRPRPAKLDTIFVPLDGSSTSERSLAMATQLAQRFDAELILYEGVVYRDRTPEEDDWQAISGQEYLQARAKEMGDLKVKVVVHESRKGPEICDQAEKYGADLIVMGSHGRSGVSRFLLGSVTEGVVQSSQCPVLVVYDR